MEEVALAQYMKSKGTAIRGLMEILKQLEACSQAKFEDEESESGHMFQMRYCSFLIGSFDAMALVYTQQFVERGATK